MTEPLNVVPPEIVSLVDVDRMAKLILIHTEIVARAHRFRACGSLSMAEEDFKLAEVLGWAIAKLKDFYRLEWATHQAIGVKQEEVK